MGGDTDMAEKKIVKTNGTLTDKEKHLLQLIRQLGNGELRILVNDGKPVRAEKIVRKREL